MPIEKDPGYKGKDLEILRELPGQLKLNILFVKTGYSGYGSISFRPKRIKRETDGLIRWLGPDIERAIKVNESLKPFGFCVSYHIDTYKSQKTVNVDYANDPSTLKVFKEILESYTPDSERFFHLRLGSLSGFSISAIRGFIYGETLPKEETPLFIKNHPFYDLLSFRLSKKYYRSEWENFRIKTKAALRMYPKLTTDLGLEAFLKFA